MKIRIATNSLASIPLIKTLAEKDCLGGILIAKKYEEFSYVMKQVFPSVPVDILTADEAETYEGTTEEDYLISFSFPYKINPKAKKSLNIHFGELPENRGPMPLFWTLKNGKKIAYVTIHELNSDYDKGDILSQKGYSIFPGENYGILNSRLGSLCVPQIMEVLNGNAEAIPQEEQEAHYNNRPTEKDTIIDWENMKAKQIEDLVNACNPVFNGARTSFNGTSINFLEVAVPDQFQLNPEQKEKPAGSVIQANNNGLVVKSADNRPVWISVAAMNEGTFSGIKLVNMGINEQIVFQ